MSIHVYGSLHELPPGFYLTDCAVSGGTLESFLRSALELSGGRLCVRIRPYSMDFPLPCPSGIGTVLPEELLHRVREAYPCHFSPALGTNYLTYLDSGVLHAVLFDNERSLGYKLTLCEKLGIPSAFIPDQKLRVLLTK